MRMRGASRQSQWAYRQPSSARDIVNELESWINEFIEGAGIPLVLVKAVWRRNSPLSPTGISAEIKTGLERRIYINQLHAAGIMNHVPQGAACEGGQDIKVVCANQVFAQPSARPRRSTLFRDSRLITGFGGSAKSLSCISGEGKICLEQPDYFGLLRPGESLALHDL